MSWFDDLDRRAFGAFARGRTPADQEETAARRWWVYMLAGLAAPAAYAMLAVPFDVFFWWQLIILMVGMTIPMTFVAGYFYGRHLRNRGVDRPWWAGPTPMAREEPKAAEKPTGTR